MHSQSECFEVLECKDQHSNKLVSPPVVDDNVIGTPSWKFNVWKNQMTDICELGLNGTVLSHTLSDFQVVLKGIIQIREQDSAIGSNANDSFSAFNGQSVGEFFL